MPVAPTTIVDAPPPAPPPAPTTTIRVSEMPNTATPTEAPKKGSARSEMIKKLRAKAGDSTPVDEPEPTGVPSSPRPTEKPVEPPAPETDSSSPTSPEPTPTATPADKKKVNPWKLVDEYKARATTAETKLLESEKRAIPEAKWKEMQTRLEQREKQLKELEEEIRYVNYSKHPEFKEKYDEPYRQAWGLAMSELDGVMVNGADGEQRPITAEDISEIAFLKAADAKPKAQEMFGDFAPEVLAFAKDIRKLHADRAASLENAKKAAGERDLVQARQMEEIKGSLVKDWNESNENIHSHEKFGAYFKPVEGDTDGNQRLAKGFELADRAFSEHPMTPGLTTEQRKSIIERHAVVRNRAAAFGRLVAQNGQKDSRIAELEKELAQYRASDPPAGGHTPPPNENGNQGSAMERMKADLRKRAKQV